MHSALDCSPACDCPIAPEGRPRPAAQPALAAARDGPALGPGPRTTRSTSELERLVDLAAKLGVGLGERLAEVGQRVADGAGVLDVEDGALTLLKVERGKDGLGLLWSGSM
jgi:hypothetical protein